MGLAERLNGLRCAQGLTQAELGRATDISQDSISKYERGNRLPGEMNLHRLSDYFGVSAAWLSGSVDDMNSGMDAERSRDDGWLRDLVDEEAHTSSMALPRILKELREEAGVSLRETANVSGVSKKCLIEYENGTLKPGFNSLVRLATYYGVTLDYLAGRENW